MGKIFVRGDTHSQFDFLPQFCRENNTTKEDYLILLGDTGINYGYIYDEMNTGLKWGEPLIDKSKSYREKIKQKISNLPITLICIQGNHDCRPEHIPSYQKIQCRGDLKCNCWVEKEYPNILFPDDGVITILGKKCLVLGGAYSIDKYWRVVHRRGYWYPDEQMSEEKKKEIFEIISKNNSYDYIFSHTCPLKYEPTELFLPFNYGEVDTSMEEFLEEVYDKTTFTHWYCGHFHANQPLTSNMTLLLDEVIQLS